MGPEATKASVNRAPPSMGCGSWSQDDRGQAKQGGKDNDGEPVAFAEGHRHQLGRATERGITGHWLDRSE
jgi:hypothetical protein